LIQKERIIMEKIVTSSAPAAIGPYSQGMVFGDLVFTSGQLPVDPATGEMPQGIEAQAEQSCKNVIAVLEQGGSCAQQVIKTTCFLADMGHFAAFNQVYAKYFPNAPARSCVAVKELPRQALCEIEAIGQR
jgi:reactive intermediate/imine deaminase